MKRNNVDLASPDLLRRSAALGHAVAQARIARNMTRQDFSERANISPSTLVRIEKGDVSVSFLSWLQAFERAGLIALLQPLADPQNDLVGEVQRQDKARRRARRSDADTDDLDF
ncbi:helix-turn-helix domain-containing protein [Paraburkholderia phosphatilytica]|uniref:helix-turn-helix domain-containing protein n=1 Tax=Paraburkholderia phosphatilytica TaxID=2282883 RepID=UPI000E51A567|nr:helix-turn-helix transcriptional regulator [Paraburkholderia phosphatilytica]